MSEVSKGEKKTEQKVALGRLKVSSPLLNDDDEFLYNYINVKWENVSGFLALFLKKFGQLFDTSFFSVSAKCSK